MSSSMRLAGKGSGSFDNEMRVDDDGRGFVYAVTETIAQHATEQGDAWNINTDETSISADTGILYFKNNDTRDFLLSAIAVSMQGGSYTANTLPLMYVYENPTGGTLISGATNATIIANRTAGDTTAIVADAYEGASGNTVTGGTKAFAFNCSQTGRSFFSNLFYDIPQGQSIGIELLPRLASGSVTVYVAIVGHFRDKKAINGA